MPLQGNVSQGLRLQVSDYNPVHIMAPLTTDIRAAGESCGVRCGCSRDKCQWRHQGGVTSVTSGQAGADISHSEEDKENNLRAPAISVSIGPVMKNKRIMAPPTAIREEADLEMSFVTKKILEKRRTSKKKAAINIKSNKISDGQRHQSPDTESVPADCSILAPRSQACTNVFSTPAFTKFRTNHIKGSTDGPFN